MNNKEIEGVKIYAKEALKTKERNVEKTKEMMRYKNSKKRCNLYVKSFPPETKEADLEELFSKFGEVEKVRMFYNKENAEEAIYAFVCFKQPDCASKAKAELNNHAFNGKSLYINHYEIKEIREL
jgi:RNA recognition motif-containing protein